MTKEDLYNAAKPLLDREEYSQALPLLEQAGNAGCHEALIALGGMYRRGLGVEHDNRTAAYYYKRAATLDDGTAALIVAEMYEDDLIRTYGYDSDYDADHEYFNAHDAVRWYRVSAERGNIKGMFHLGQSYFHGDGCDISYRDAFRYLREPAEAGIAEAQYLMGRLYEYGGIAPECKSKEEERKTAAVWYEKAAAQGHNEAKERLNQLSADK